MNPPPTNPPAASAAAAVPTGWYEFCAGITAVLRSWSAFRTAVQGGWGGVESHDKAEFLRQTLYGYFAMGGRPPGGPVANTSTTNHIQLRPPNTLLSPEDLEDHLAIYLEEEFSVQLEDASERQVAQTLQQLYQTCLVQHDYTLATQLVSLAINEQQQLTAVGPVVQAVGEDEDEDDEMMGTTSSASAAVPQQQPTSQQQQLPQQQIPPQNIPPTPSSPNLPSAADYAAELLFATPAEQQRHLEQRLRAPPTPSPNVRQLGEAPRTNDSNMLLDDDGFCAVVTQKKKKKNQNRGS